MCVSLSPRHGSNASESSRMTPLETESSERPEHPVDVVERLAALNDWAFDRADEDEISILVGGRLG